MKRLLLLILCIGFANCKSKTDWRVKYQQEKLAEASKDKPPNKKSSKAFDKPLSIDDLAKQIDVSKQALKNEKLYKMILDWYGTPYAFGNQSRMGIDCSGFTQLVYKEVYKIDLPRQSKMMAEYIKKTYTKNLKEGDLVFFSFGNSKEINHVGIYLHNNKFVHASTSKGVIISDITEPWYGNFLVKCGPIK
ncbi:MAG TPA: C40 family peptidase [Flavobacterium sp.]|nr:C40 family peptidase [Flavobacterium sp.]